MENAAKKKKLLYSVALLFVCLVLTLTTSLTFAYFFNRRGETASYKVGQVKLDMVIGTYTDREYASMGDTNYNQVPYQAEPVKQLIPNMPMFKMARVELARKRDESGNAEWGEYAARACYIRVRFYFEFVGEDGKDLLREGSPLSDTQKGSLSTYLTGMSTQLAGSGTHSNKVYAWATAGDSCFYLVHQQENLDTANPQNITMFELTSDGMLIEPTTPNVYEDDSVMEDDHGSREGAFAYLTTSEFRYPSSATNFPFVLYEDGGKKFISLRVTLISEAIQSEYLSKVDENGNTVPVTSLADVKSLMDETFGTVQAEEPEPGA